MAVYDLTEKVWNFRFGTWRGRETGKATVLVAVRGNLLGARRRASRSGSRGGGSKEWRQELGQYNVQT